jgi:hypothetical protein
MHAVNHKFFKNALSNILILRRFLGTPVSVGTAMLLLTFEPDPWATTQQIAEMSDVSEDTARRRVRDLVSINRADCRIEAGRHYFRLRPAFAQSLVAKMKWDHTIIGDVPDIPQPATADCD